MKLLNFFTQVLILPKLGIFKNILNVYKMLFGRLQKTKFQIKFIKLILFLTGAKL
jgi:hypothetical protein